MPRSCLKVAGGKSALVYCFSRFNVDTKNAWVVRVGLLSHPLYALTAGYVSAKPVLNNRIQFYLFLVGTNV